MTTINTVNSTGKLIAIKDGATHVSVYPIDMSKMPKWIESRENSENSPYELTKILKLIVK